ncbi:MAG: nuclear transport factor 2 family protein [Chitinophagaceae bacterium]|nr:nuclear transport factor 2 family protein [Chitinophagaceae bacterium]
MLLCTTTSFAQQENEGIKKCISTFFDGMKANDTMMIKTSLDSSCFLFSVVKTKDGRTVLEAETIADFFKQVAQLKGNKLDEQLLSYDIKTDGAMAIAWMPYKFYFNEQFSHCGVNVFTLIKRADDWKIMGITDTRRKQGCE